VMGQGIAMGDLTLLTDEVKTGKLVCPLADLVLRLAVDDYYIYGPAAKWSKPRVLAFRQWLESVSRG
jgi:LysR family glycine cleavage system transcriptional activator